MLTVPELDCARVEGHLLRGENVLVMAKSQPDMRLVFNQMTAHIMGENRTRYSVDPDMMTIGCLDTHAVARFVCDTYSAVLDGFLGRVMSV